MRERIAYAGGPKTGKTTLARQHADARHTDDLVPLGWSGSSAAASYWFDEDGGPVEGVTAIRALRKWLARNPEGRPIDRLVYLSTPHVPLTRAQRTMQKQSDTIFESIRPELERRGVKIEEPKPQDK